MSSVDYSDYIYHVDNRGKKNRRYRAYCLDCGADRGYVRKSRQHKLCHSCNSIKGAELGKNWAGKEEEVLTKIRDVRSKQVIVHSAETKRKIAESNKLTKRKQLYDKNGFHMTDSHRKLRKRFSSLLYMRLKRSGCSKESKSTFDVVNYTLEDLKKHLESQFVEGMSWDNYGSEWHIDHIIPDSAFNYSSIHDDEFVKSWSLNNLQPLWVKDNLRKANKYAVPEE